MPLTGRRYPATLWPSSMTTVLVAHGALGSAAQMQPLAAALRALSDGEGRDDVRVEVLEFPGHGESALSDASRFRLTGFVDVMAHAVARLPAAPVLFGYSMGGYVGLALEARAPGTFAGIVTLGTKFVWDAATAEREAVRLDPEVIAVKVPRFATALAARHAGAGGWETVVQRTATLLRANGSAPLVSRDVLETIAIPVTVAVGANDETVTIAESEWAADAMPHGRCVVLDAVTHPIERAPIERLVAIVAGELRGRA